MSEEGQKISELLPVDTLYDGCCFPIVQNGETRKVTFATMQELLRGNDGEDGQDGALIRFNGEWQNHTLYVNDESYIDLVYYQGSTYACLISHTSTSSITPLSDGYWTLVAEKGDTGEAGQDGEDGGIISESQIFDLCHPIGEVYTQYPDELTPQELYGRGTWTEITSNYAGLFFRAAGGNAAAFGTTQNEELPNVTGTFRTGTRKTDEGTDGTSGIVSADGHGGATKTYQSGANAYTYQQWKIDLSQSSSIYKNGGHVTPVNTAIKIWKRTA